MNFLKRATPWMITLLILLGAYWASYVWYYKPKRVLAWWASGSTISSKDKALEQFYKPMILCEEERLKQKSRDELLSQCQGEWEGKVRPRSDGLTSFGQLIQVQAIIEGDQFKIIRAEAMPELVGVTWKVGCLFDGYAHCGISSNKSYPSSSSIFLSYTLDPSGEESLDEGFDFHFNGNHIKALLATKQLVRPTATPPSSN